MDNNRVSYTLRRFAGWSVRFVWQCAFAALWTIIVDVAFTDRLTFGNTFLEGVTFTVCWWLGGVMFNDLFTRNTKAPS